MSSVEAAVVHTISFRVNVSFAVRFSVRVRVSVSVSISVSVSVSVGICTSGGIRPTAHECCAFSLFNDFIPALFFLRKHRVCTRM